jgi:hypothetical protein
MTFFKGVVKGGCYQLNSPPVPYASGLTIQHCFEDYFIYLLLLLFYEHLQERERDREGYVWGLFE